MFLWATFAHCIRAYNETRRVIKQRNSCSEKGKRAYVSKDAMFRHEDTEGIEQETRVTLFLISLLADVEFKTV